MHLNTDLSVINKIFEEEHLFLVGQSTLKQKKGFIVKSSDFSVYQSSNMSMRVLIMTRCKPLLLAIYEISLLLGVYSGNKTLANLSSGANTINILRKNIIFSKLDKNIFPLDY